MGFYRQFEIFDPLTGRAPDYPFRSLSSIVEQARAFLVGRTHSELYEAARIVDWLIDEYFSDAARGYARHLIENDAPALRELPPDERTEEAVIDLLNDLCFRDEAPPDLANPDNTSEVDALRESLKSRSVATEDFPHAEDYEYFSVLALWLIGDSIEALNWSWDKGPIVAESEQLLGNRKAAELGQLFDDVTQALQDFGGANEEGIRLAQAGEAAIRAMAALGEAQLHKAEQESTSLLASFAETFPRQVAAQVKSDAGRTAAAGRHKENHQMKKEVMEWCEENLAKYRSMDAAADAVAGKLVPVKFRTARNWIAEYRKVHPSARRR